MKKGSQELPGLRIVHGMNLFSKNNFGNVAIKAWKALRGGGVGGAAGLHQCTDASAGTRLFFFFVPDCV